MSDKCEHRGCANHSYRGVKEIVAKGLFFLRGFAFDDRLIMRTEYFAQERHASLHKQSKCQAKDKRHKQEWSTQIGRDARTEKVGKSYKDEVDRTGKF